jgi:hypothetical protein
MKYLLFLSLLAVSACQATTNKPLTFGMNEDQLNEVSELALCLDHQKYQIDAVDKAVKNRKVNCTKVLTHSYRNLASKSTNVEVCTIWMNGTTKIGRDAFTKEKNKRKLDCEAILSIKAQQDAVFAQRQANQQRAWQDFTNSLQNNQPTYTSCSAIGNTVHCNSY